VKKYREPILVSSVDGVGTKLKLAFALDKHDTIGADLVNHCVNDIAVLGAEPLFFLDYLGTGKLEPHVSPKSSRASPAPARKTTARSSAAKTAQMPGFYQPGEYDLSGTIVGVVEKSKMLNGQKTIKRGDVVIGIESSGLHTNGYSLGRKIFFEQLKLKPSSRIPGSKLALGAELLKVHVSYGPLVQKLLKKFNQGGRSGVSAERRHLREKFAAVCRRAATRLRPHHRRRFVDNIRECCRSRSTWSSAKVSWTCCRLQDHPRNRAACRTTNCIRFSTWASAWFQSWLAEKANDVLKFIRAEKHKAWIIGEVVKARAWRV